MLVSGIPILHKDVCPEGLPTVMAHSSLGFGISVLHIPQGGNHLQQLIHLSKIAPCHKYSGTLSNVIWNETLFGFTESGFFPVVLHNYHLWFLYYSLPHCAVTCFSVTYTLAVDALGQCAIATPPAPRDVLLCLNFCAGKDFPFSLMWLLTLLL